jgi:regulator of RNase E activity RraA
VVVYPGDFVIGDADGVVVVEKSRIGEVAKKALAQRSAETDKESQVRKGASLVKMFHLESLES